MLLAAEALLAGGARLRGDLLLCGVIDEDGRAPAPRRSRRGTARTPASWSSARASTW